MGFFRRYSTVLGFLALILVVVLLLSTPNLAFSPGVSFIDSELHRSTGDEAYVRTKLDFGSAEHLDAFPREIGEWEGYDYDTAGVKQQLGADVALLRGYGRPGLYQPIFFLIMQAKTESSFHPPAICRLAQGYKIQEQGKEQVVVTDSSWVEPSSSSMSIPVELMVSSKESGGKVTERRVALYCYMKGNQFTSDAVTMIQVEALAPVEGPYDGILGVEKEFLATAFPFMFEPGEGEEQKPLAAQLAGFGIGGYFAIVFLLSMPLAIIVYPRIRRRSGNDKHISTANEA